MASLRMFLSASKPDFHVCGGSLIAPRWVLTAAHCAVLPLDSVVVGGFDIANASDGERFSITRTIIHPSFIDPTIGDDVALLELDHDANAPTVGINDDRDFPRAVALADAFESASNATVIGWGDTNPNAPPPDPTTLQEVEVPIVDNTSCNAAYSPTTIPSGMICAGRVDGGRDSCQGDSGGPLLSWSNSEPMVVGLVSWGNSCALPHFPGVYTRVSSYVPWIRGQGVPVTMKSDRNFAATWGELVGANNIANHEPSRVQHLFEQTPASALRHHWWHNGIWHGEDLYANAPVSIGPPVILNGVAAGNNGVPTQHVFARETTNGHLIHYWWINYAGWQPPVDLTITSGLNQAMQNSPVAINGPRVGDFGIPSQHVFARGPNSTLQHIYWINNTGWHGENLTTVLATPETLKPRGELAVINAVNGVDASGTQIRTQHVFARGSLNNLVHYWWVSDGNVWQVENLTTGTRATHTIIGDPVVINGTTDGNGGVRTQDVFALGADNTLVHYHWINYAGWTAENLTTVTAAGNAGKIAGRLEVLNGPKRGNDGVLSQEVFARSTSGHLIHYDWLNNRASAWQFHDLTTDFAGPAITAPPRAIIGTSMESDGVADINVFARGSGDDLIHYYWFNTLDWNSENLSGATSPAVRSLLVLQRGLERGNDGIEAVHVASKGTTLPVSYDWLNYLGWSSQVVN